MMRARGDIGETLIEVLLTVMIVGATVTALIASLGTVSNAGNAQRIGVRTDVVMRNYAEATKAAVQGCAEGATYAVAYLPPAGFTVSASPVATTCPTVDAPQVLNLRVVGPSGLAQTMQIRVRTP
jgi:Tfp pilus assembly protein PilV